MSCVELPLSNSDGRFLVDAEVARGLDLSRWKWRINSDGYVRRDTWRDGKRVFLMLHRVITDAKPGQVVDHINGDRLDNRRANLRLTNYQGNARNVRKPGKLKGVSWHHKGKKWEVHIGAGRRRPNGKARRLYLGLFRDPEHAAQTYDRAALYYFGEFASLNYPALHDIYLAQLTWVGIRAPLVPLVVLGVPSAERGAA